MQGKPRCSNAADPGDFPSPESTVLMPLTQVTSTFLEQVKSCGSVSCLINTEPPELLRLQPSEPIASESVASTKTIEKRPGLDRNNMLHEF